MKCNNFLGQAYRNVCPANYYCPTGTGDYLTGLVAGDAVNRRLNATMANPYLDESYIRYFANDDVRVISAHDKRCFSGIDTDLSLRYEVDWIPAEHDVVNPSLLYLYYPKPDHTPYQNDSFVTGQDDGMYYRPVTTQVSILEDLNCGRDHKWRLVDQTIYRNECNCTNFFHVVIAVYRLWKCTGNGKLDNLGIFATCVYLLIRNYIL